MRVVYYVKRGVRWRKSTPPWIVGRRPITTHTMMGPIDAA